MKRMNKEVRAKWLEALRSGDYKQAKNKLASRSRKSHCCLGVLCELAVKEGVIGEPKTDRDNACQMFGENDISFLPEAVRKWAGLASHDPAVGQTDIGDAITLSSKNDDGCTFPEIADLIEQYL